MDQNKLVLVAEDEDLIAETLVDQIKENELSVILEKDGLAAWESIKKNNPKLVILDLIMPKLDGFEVLKKIKSSKKHKKTPVIILSNLGQDSDIAECKKLGANDYFVKSNISIEALIEVIKQYI